MNKFKHITKLGTFVLLLTLAFIACTDKNDWGVDGAYNRLFSVSKMSVSAGATEIEFTWTGTPNTEYYIIELSKDSLYDAVRMGEHSSSMTFGEDKSIRKSPVTLSNLDSNSNYFLRVKAVSSNVEESKWSYLEDYSFKTKSEQIMNSVNTADVLAKQVKLSWLAGAAVTHLEVIRTKDNAVIKTIELTANQKADGEATVDDLEPDTAYRINLYNGDIVRGYATITTTPEVPEADKIIFLTEDDVLNQDFFDALTDKTVTIVLPGNSAYYEANTINLPTDVSIAFFGLPGDNKAVLAIKQFNLGSKHGFIRFTNLDISGDSSRGGIASEYLFNQSSATVVNAIEFNDCFLHGFKNTPLIRLQGSDSKTIGNLIIDNCVIYGSDSRSYSLVHVDANSGSGKIENMKFTNSTVMLTGKSFILSAKTDFTGLTIKDCTFSQIGSANGDYLIDCSTTAYGPSDGFVFENCMLGSTIGENNNGIRMKGTINPVNCYSTSNWVTKGSHIPNLSSYASTEANLFVDSANGNFTIKDNSFSGRRSCGDPRWYMPE